MKTLEDQLHTAGLTVVGTCTQLRTYGTNLMSTSPLLQDMSAQEVDVLGQSMLLIRADAGQALIREGETGEWMLLLLSGTVDITKQVEQTAEDGEKTISTSRIGVIRCGASIGEMSMLDSEPRYATCTAIEAAEAGVLGRREIALLIRDHPGVGAKLLVKITQLMAQRLRNTSNQLVKLLQK